MKEVYIFGTGASRALSNVIPLGCELGWYRWAPPIIGMYETEKGATAQHDKIDKTREGQIFREFRETILKYYSNRENIKKYFPYPENNSTTQYKELKDLIPDLDYLINNQLAFSPSQIKDDQGEYIEYSSKVIFNELTFDILLADTEIKKDVNAIGIIKQIIHEHLIIAAQHCFSIQDIYNPYKMFKKMLAKKNHDDITLVSLNYDYFLNDSDGQDSISFNYIIDFNDIYPSVRNNKNNAKHVFTLLKPHGSLDWQKCTNCGKLYLQGPWMQWDDFNKTKCTVKGCNGLMQSFIFMPHVDYPNTNNTIIQTITSILEQSLKEAERIIIIGYSFPDYDIYMRKYFNKKYLERLREIEVVDFEENENKWPEREAITHKNYSGMLSDTTSNIKIKVFLKGFQEWLKGQM